MPVACVVENQIKDDADAAGLGLPDQGAHILHVAEHRVDRLVVRDVVAVIDLGRGKDRAQPQRVNAKLGQIVEPPHNTGQIADAVAV